MERIRHEIVTISTDVKKMCPIIRGFQIIDYHRKNFEFRDRQMDLYISSYDTRSLFFKATAESFSKLVSSRASYWRLHTTPSKLPGIQYRLSLIALAIICTQLDHILVVHERPLIYRCKNTPPAFYGCEIACLFQIHKWVFMKIIYPCIHKLNEIHLCGNYLFQYVIKVLQLQQRNMVKPVMYIIKMKRYFLATRIICFNKH